MAKAKYNLILKYLSVKCLPFEKERIRVAHFKYML